MNGGVRRRQWSLIVLCSMYWPYKVWRQGEKQRQQNMQNFRTQSKLSASPLLPPLTADRAERAGSPYRAFTPARRPSTTHHVAVPVETIVVERPVTRYTNDRPSRRGHRVATSLNGSINESTNRLESRGKTPLI